MTLRVAGGAGGGGGGGGGVAVAGARPQSDSFTNGAGPFTASQTPSGTTSVTLNGNQLRTNGSDYTIAASQLTPSTNVAAISGTLIWNYLY